MAKRVIQGTVVSDKMDKTVVVSVERRTKHRLYHKVINVTKRYKAHDEENNCRLGDRVNIIECAPVSKGKHWRVIEVLSRGDVAEIAPAVIGREIEEAAGVVTDEMEGSEELPGGAGAEVSAEIPADEAEDSADATAEATAEETAETEGDGSEDQE